MAKKTEENKPVLERTYNVPLRKEFLKVPRYKRAKKAGTALKEFLARHMKSDNIKIGKFLNLELWKRGIKNPPHHVSIVATKDKDGVVRAELAGALKEEKPAPKKAAAKEAKVSEEKPEVKETAVSVEEKAMPEAVVPEAKKEDAKKQETVKPKAEEKKPVAKKAASEPKKEKPAKEQKK